MSRLSILAATTLLAFAAGCDTGAEDFVGFDSGIPEDAGVWEKGEVLTCAHDPLPAYGATRWDLADDFPSRASIGSNYIVPPGAEDLWELSDENGGVLLGTGGGDLVAQAIRTSPAMGFLGEETVVFVDVNLVDFSVDSPTVFCRMSDADPPEHYYGATLQTDRLTLTEDGESLGEIEHEGFAPGLVFRMVLSCQERTSDTLVTAFLFKEGPEGFERLGCVHAFDRTPRGAGSVGLGLQSGQTQFDNLRVRLP